MQNSTLHLQKTNTENKKDKETLSLDLRIANRMRARPFCVRHRKSRTKLRNILIIETYKAVQSRKKKKLWVHPLLQKRETELEGTFCYCFRLLQDHEVNL